MPELIYSRNENEKNEILIQSISDGILAIGKNNKVLLINENFRLAFLPGYIEREGITNQDNIVATIDEQDGGDMLMQGTIKKGEATLADITTTSNDILLIRYTDGTIESL